MIYLLRLAFVLSIATQVFAQPGVFSRDDLIQYTPEWKGERFDDGRPKVPDLDGIIERMRAVTLEEAWAVLRNEGFTFQYEDGWMSIHPEKILVGRALTAVWMPGRSRADVHKVIEEVASAGLVGVGESGARDLGAEPYVVELGFHGAQASLDVA